MPDSYSGQPGVILPIGSSDKDYLLSGLCILGAMSFKLPFLDCHLTLANIIVTNIPSFKAQQYAAMADLSPRMVQAGLPGGYNPHACEQRCLVLLGTPAQCCWGWWAPPQHVDYSGFWIHCGFH